MPGFEIFIEWIKKRSFSVSIVVFLLIYIWWFVLTPWNPQNDCCSNFNYRLGLTLLVFYGGSGALWWFTKNRAYLAMFFRLITIFFFILVSLCTAFFMPKVIETAKYNNATYYLVAYPTWPDSPWTIYQLTKWQGFFRYDSHDVGIHGGFKIKYDQKMQLVSVVRVFSTRYERLIYLDSIPPRRFDDAIDVEFEGKRYRVSYECNPNPKYPYLCESYIYTLYHCELDNTSCIPFPFQYTGDYAFEMYIENGSIVDDIDVYFDIGEQPGKKTLIYAYGEHPRCFAEGCEILEEVK